MPIRMGSTELIIILIIVILLFGVGRIGKIAGELGSGIKAFREGIASDNDEEEMPEATAEKVQACEGFGKGIEWTFLVLVFLKWVLSS